MMGDIEDLAKVIDKAMRAQPYLEDGVLKSGEVTLYINAALSKLAKLVREEGAVVTNVVIFTNHRMKNKINTRVLDKSFNALLGQSIGDVNEIEMDCYWATFQVVFLKENSHTDYRLSFHGIAMDRAVSEKYFCARWALQIIDKMSARDADRAARLL